MINQDLKRMYEKYVQIAKQRKDNVLTFTQWQDRRNRLLG